MAKHRPVLVGLNNPYSTDPSNALSPIPSTGSGRRLWLMMNRDTTTNILMTMREYMVAFDRRNLVDRRKLNGSTAQYMRSRADQMKQTFKPGQTVVLLGEEVRKAFRVPKLLLHPQVVDSVVYRQIPHPSGRTRFYNDPVLKTVVGMLLEDLAK